MNPNKTVSFLSTALLLACASASAQHIEASFSESTSYTTSFTGNTTGEQTAVDQWGGIPGKGWTTSWTLSGNGSSMRDKQVLGETPLTGGEGSYVQFRMQTTNQKNRYWMNSRSYESYGEVDLTQPVAYEFLFRPDDIDGFSSGGGTYFHIKEGGELYGNNGATWFILTGQGTTKYWVLGDGKGDGNLSYVNTGLEIIAGQTYKFSIISDPRSDSWNISIDNLDDQMPEVYFEGLGFMHSQDAQAGTLNFLTMLSSAEFRTATYHYSLDSIKISSGN